jgi:hypothetical protein
MAGFLAHLAGGPSGVQTMNQADLLGVLAKLHRSGRETVTASMVAEELWPNARHNNANGQVFNLSAGVAGRMMERCRAVVRTDTRTWVIVPEYLETPKP